jgi:imidazole glycerol-phosphate synthase subunit HisF
MKNTRVIPILLIKDGGLYKSVQFKKFTYIGDPINAVKIFNDKEVDEICILDISATKEQRGPNIDFITEIISEAFMPLSYGGGVSHIDQVKKLMYNGVEKIVLNNALHTQPNLASQIANIYGVQSVVASIDVKKNIWGKYKIVTQNATKEINADLISFAKNCEQNGVGEIIINSIDKDGMCTGYDTELISKVAHAVNIPVIAAGGAWEINHFIEAKKAGASAVAAGSMFVFHGKHKAVLITYPERNLLKTIDVNNGI